MALPMRTAEERAHMAISRMKLGPALGSPGYGDLCAQIVAALHEQLNGLMENAAWVGAATERFLLAYQDGKAPDVDCKIILDRLISEAVAKERRRCADIAWKMQQEQFGGGTAIGNAIEMPW